MLIIKCVVWLALAQLPGSPGDEAVTLPPVPTKTIPGSGQRLIPPPPIVPPGLSLAAPAAPGVVPGGEVYQLPQWVVDLINELSHKRPVAPTPIPTPTPVVQPGPLSPAVVAALNVERAKRGLSPLGVDQKCTEMAAYWAIWMGRHDILTHGDFFRRARAVYPNRAAGEIAAQGFTDIPSVVAGWMSSPGHRANILGDFTAAGAGHAVAADGTPYDCCDFVK